MMTEHETWLELGKEDAIEPELPICDTHHHLWDMPGRRYLLDELFRDIGGGHDIVRTVFVENDSVKKKDTL
jgi:predicted TIM-barrel fold metal-dependent hydrolase